MSFQLVLARLRLDPNRLFANLSNSFPSPHLPLLRGLPRCSAVSLSASDPLASKLNWLRRPNRQTIKLLQRGKQSLLNAVIIWLLPIGLLSNVRVADGNFQNQRGLVTKRTFRYSSSSAVIFIKCFLVHLKLEY